MGNSMGIENAGRGMHPEYFMKISRCRRSIWHRQDYYVSLVQEDSIYAKEPRSQAEVMEDIVVISLPSTSAVVNLLENLIYLLHLLWWPSISPVHCIAVFLLSRLTRSLEHLRRRIASLKTFLASWFTRLPWVFQHTCLRSILRTCSQLIKRALRLRSRQNTAERKTTPTVPHKFLSSFRALRTHVSKTHFQPGKWGQGKSWNNVQSWANQICTPSDP